MPRTATIKSIGHAYRMMKAMEADGTEWGKDYRHAGAQALKEVLEGRMTAAVDRHLEEMAGRDEARCKMECRPTEGEQFKFKDKKFTWHWGDFQWPRDERLTLGALSCRRPIPR